MKKIYFLFFVLFIGCTSVSDYSTKFLLSGHVTTNTSTGNAANLKLRMIDINLDDRRPEGQRVIIDTNIVVGENFHYEKSYFWGSSKSGAYKKGKVKIVVYSDNCRSWEGEFFINDFYNYQKIVSIDVGKINLECN